MDLESFYQAVEPEFDNITHEIDGWEQWIDIHLSGSVRATIESDDLGYDWTIWDDEKEFPKNCIERGYIEDCPEDAAKKFIEIAKKYQS